MVEATLNIFFAHLQPTYELMFYVTNVYTLHRFAIFMFECPIIGLSPCRNVRDRPEMMSEFERRKGLENICEHQSLKMSKF